MIMRYHKLALTAGFALAMAFTFSCSGDDGGGDNNPVGGGTPGDNGSSPSSAISSSNDGSSSSDGSSDSSLPDGRTSSSSYPFIPYPSSGSADLCAGFVNGTEREHFGKNKAQFCDSRDGRKYVYVTIGEGATAQTWMAENLNYNAYSSLCAGGRVFDHQVVDEGYCDGYGDGYGIYTLGRFYTWETATNCHSWEAEACSSTIVQGICPSGWHIPSNAEWDALFHFVDGTSGDDSPYRSTTAGKYLKAQDGWDDSEAYRGEDTYGFAALPGGYFEWGANYFRDGGNGYWWSSSWWHSDSRGFEADFRQMYHNYYNVYASYQYGTRISYNVRCIKDSP